MKLVPNVWQKYVMMYKYAKDPLREFFIYIIEKKPFIIAIKTKS